MASPSTQTIELPALENQKPGTPVESRFPSPKPVAKPAPYVIKLAGSVPN